MVKQMSSEIANDIPLPAEHQPKPRKTRARKQAAGGTVKKTANPAASLIAALKFVAVAQKKNGPPNVQFCNIFDKWVAAFDGVLMAACPIEEDLEACPQTLQFIDALSKASDELSITQLSANALAVSSGVFRALVPCVTPDEIPMYGPDPQIAAITDDVKTALLAVAGLATETSPSATFAAVLLQADTAVATDGSAILEYWHGVDLPPGLMLPKASALAIGKCAKTLVGFGYSANSATFWFEDGSFMKTHLFAERYPNYSILFECPDANYWPIPDEFYKGIRAVESFSPNGNVFFKDGFILSRLQKETATSYKIEGLPDKMGFSVKLLIAVEHAFKSVHFDINKKKVFFFSERIRGVLMALDMGTEETAYELSKQTGADYDSFDNDIPF
ncbi:hypothetical protein [Pseudomonas phage KP1]|uniref:Uncharacterized protein n=1 Tax=Pseudomonas phage KP1 TaxID=2562463 RepID=A0A6G5QAL6_9CAUD|nr:hypothetical protein PM391_gp25 [Pseudomonas phage KP1]QBZ71735.1 hypothetical protein [Pseudomonas phage KP1]